MNEPECYELKVTGSNRSEMRHLPRGNPEDIAKEFLLGDGGFGLYNHRDLPDSAAVVLHSVGSEEWVPPRCRKARTRLVYHPEGMWTLGHFRAMQGTNQKRV